MKIQLTTVHVDDQQKALRFYTEVLGFVKKADFIIRGLSRRRHPFTEREPAELERCHALALRALPDECSRG